jgi:hypothetical protein
MSIKEKIEQQFVADFDLDILLKFVEDKLTKSGEVNIGLVYDRENTSLKLKSSFTEGYSTSKKWPTFARANNHFYWTADCQIPHQLVPYVKKKLAEQGLNTKCRGMCGYDTYDVMVVTL